MQWRNPTLSAGFLHSSFYPVVFAPLTAHGINLSVTGIFFLNCLFSLNMEYSLSHIFQNSCPWPVPALPGLWASLTENHAEETVTMPQQWWARVCAEALSCSRALGDAEPEQLLCPHPCQPQLWADSGPLCRVDLGEEGKNEGVWWQHKFAFGLRYSLGPLSLQPHDHLESMEFESRRILNQRIQMSWELLVWLPYLVFRSSTTWNKQNSSNILFLRASATQLLLFCFHRGMWYQVIKYDSAGPTASQPQYSEGH